MTDPTPAAALEVRDLSVAYARAGSDDNLVVSGVDFRLEPGTVLGMAGESGCGKSTTGLAAIGYRAPGVRIRSGSSVLGGTDDLLAMDAEQLRSMWGRRIAYVAQNATTALNPALRVGEQLAQSEYVDEESRRMAMQQAHHIDEAARQRSSDETGRGQP